MNAVAERLAAVREQMAAAGYDALVVPRADEYLGEYLPGHNERLHWISNFTGSAGTVVVLADRAAIFVDGRYTVQVRAQVDADLFEFHHLVEEPHAHWLTEVLNTGGRVACDPRMHSLRWFRETQALLADAGLELVADTDNLIDRCWLDRPAARIAPALLLSEEFSGRSSLDKRRSIGAGVAAQGADAALVFAPDSVSWLLNIRGADIPRLPVVLGMALLEAGGDVTLMIEPGRVPPGLAEHVGDGLRIVEEERAGEVLAGYSGRTVLADPDTANAWAQLALEQSGATLLPGSDPVLLPRACKNPVELAGMRAAHLRDGAAEVRFLAWLDAEVAAGRLHDEAYLSDQLEVFRAANERFREVSFDTISAAGANAAMCHYNHLNGQPAQLQMNTAYLLDSGGHYTDGTTDITRTVAIGDPGSEIRRMFTLVLKGHIALDQARFVPGTTGSQIDSLARQFLWQAGCDYDHGTGHGVGTFLSVHEGPQRIAKQASTVPLQAGMVVSNEPGYYRDGQFGIRCENLVEVCAAEVAGGDLPVLGFRALTLVPFDRRLLDLSLMSEAEIDWLNVYHARVLAEVGPLLNESDLAWLTQAVRPLVI